MFKRSKITDVTYLNFAALAYNNWGGIPCGTDLKDAVFDIRKKNTKKLNIETRHLYMVYSECEKYETPLWDDHFNGWKFLYAANRTKLARDMFGFDLADNGFYAVAFVNEETNDMIISFRGTDNIKDIAVDAWLGFFDNYSTQLTCVYWFVKYCSKLLLEGPDVFGTVTMPFIHFTGHSLGGGLAEYAHIVCGNSGTHSVTWNGLGMGARFKRQLSSTTMQLDAIMDILALLKVPNSMMVADKVLNYAKSKLAGFSIGLNSLERNVEDTIREEVKNILLNECSHFNRNLVNTVWRKDSKFFKNLRYEFGFIPSMKREEREKEIQEVIMKDAGEILGEQYFKYVVEEIVAVVIGLAKYTDRCDKMGYEENVNGLTTVLTNFIFKDDWTSIIHKRCGLTVDVTSSDAPRRESAEDLLNNDGKLRVLKETLKNFGFKKHGIGNFIMYLDDDGNITPDKIRKSILLNVVKNIAPFDASYISKAITRIDDTVFEIKKGFTDVMVGLPTLVGHDNEVKKIASKKLTHWDLYCRKLDFISISSKDDEFEIGSWNNMNFDGMDGTSPRLVVKVIG